MIYQIRGGPLDGDEWDMAEIPLGERVRVPMELPEPLLWLGPCDEPVFSTFCSVVYECVGLAEMEFKGIQ